LSIKCILHLSLQLLLQLFFGANKNIASYETATLEMQPETRGDLHVGFQSLLSDFKHKWNSLVNVNVLSTRCNEDPLSGPRVLAHGVLMYRETQLRHEAHFRKLLLRTSLCLLFSSTCCGIATGRSLRRISI
jgi:hypothetical protein